MSPEEEEFILKFPQTFFLDEQGNLTEKESELFCIRFQHLIRTHSGQTVNVCPTNSLKESEIELLQRFVDCYTAYNNLKEREETMTQASELMNLGFLNDFTWPSK